MSETNTTKEEVFSKYPKIKYLGDEENKDLLVDPEEKIIIEEKIDGANFRYMIKDNRIIFGSRNQAIGDSEIEIGGNWKRCVEYIKEKYTKNPFPEGYLYYGECIIKHSMSYDWDKIPPFLGFDILSFDTEKFIQYENKKQIYNKSNIELVPLIKKIKAKELKEFTDEDIPQSKYSTSRAEGVVFKNYKNQVFAKYVAAKFKETHRKTFGGGKKHAKDDGEVFIAIYCTNARIEKCIFKLIDSGVKLDMLMMRDLMKMVFNDIIEENWKEICWSTYSLNFPKLRSEIGKRCVLILKQMIVNNILNKGVI